MKTTSVGFIGGGRITRIFLQAFKGKESWFDKVYIHDSNAEVCRVLTQSFPGIVCCDLETASRQPVVIIALHPPVIMETLALIAGTLDPEALVISLAPKITISQIASGLGTMKVVRMIPNATSFINEGYNPVTFAPGFDPDFKAATLKLLRVLGHTFEVEEQKLEAYAILSAMLPTYFWFQWQELCELGLKMGLTGQQSRESVQQTLLASIKIMFESGLSQQELVDLVPVKPIGESEDQISEIYRTRLMSLYARIKPS